MAVQDFREKRKRGYQAESAYIASIYPGKLWPIKKNVGPDPDVSSPRCTVYELEPVSKRGGKPCVIEVCDSFENVEDVASGAENGKKVWMPRLVPHEQLTENLIREWAGNLVDVPTGGAPGIILLKDSVPHVDEIKRMTEMQTIFAEHYFNMGEMLARENHTREISPTMRLMAEWLGRERLWSDPASLLAAEESMIECPACFAKIDSRSRVCRHCGERLKPAAELAPVTA